MARKLAVNPTKHMAKALHCRVLVDHLTLVGLGRSLAKVKFPRDEIGVLGVDVEETSIDEHLREIG